MKRYLVREYGNDKIHLVEADGFIKVNFGTRPTEIVEFYHITDESQKVVATFHLRKVWIEEE